MAQRIRIPILTQRRLLCSRRPVATQIGHSCYQKHAVRNGSLQSPKMSMATKGSHHGSQRSLSTQASLFCSKRHQKRGSTLLSAAFTSRRECPLPPEASCSTREFHLLSNSPCITRKSPLPLATHVSLQYVLLGLRRRDREGNRANVRRTNVYIGTEKQGVCVRIRICLLF